MSGNVVERSCVSIPLIGSELRIGGIVKNKEITVALKTGLKHFCIEIEAQQLGAK